MELPPIFRCHNINFKSLHSYAEQNMKILEFRIAHMHPLEKRYRLMTL